MSKRGGGGGGGRGKLQRSAPAPPKINRAPFHFSTFSWRRRRVSTPVSEHTLSSMHGRKVQPLNLQHQETWDRPEGSQQFEPSVRPCRRSNFGAGLTRPTRQGPAPFLFSQSRAEVNERRREGEMWKLLNPYPYTSSMLGPMH